MSHSLSLQGFICCKQHNTACLIYVVPSGLQNELLCVVLPAGGLHTPAIMCRPSSRGFTHPGYCMSSFQDSVSDGVRKPNPGGVIHNRRGCEPPVIRPGNTSPDNTKTKIPCRQNLEIPSARDLYIIKYM